MKVLALPGSLRRGSYNRRLLEAAVACAPAEMQVALYDELAAVPLFNEDLEAHIPDSVAHLRQQVAAADGLLIATPEYNQSMPGVLKNAIDWLSRPAPDEVLIGKPVAVIGISPGRWGTRLAQSALRQVLNATESLVMANPALYVREAERLFDADGRLIDPATQGSLRSLLVAFGKWVDLTDARATRGLSGQAPQCQARAAANALP
jgi:chromate reductase, NAD(P)H dehydrogenase (quinone)